MTPESNMWLIAAWMYVLIPSLTEGGIVFNTDPLVPRIYNGAGGGVYVCTVNAYDDVTDEKLVQYKFARLPDADFFVIEESGVIATSQGTIAKSVGSVYVLRVYGTLAGNTYDMEVRVTVSRRNIYSPVFQQLAYTFYVFADAAPISYIGSVKATDNDPDDYNRNLVYYSMDNEQFIVDSSTGNLVLRQSLPADRMKYELEIVVSDSGTPTLFGNTSVTIAVTSLPAPKHFCNAFTGENGTVCWKVPNMVDTYDGFKFRTVRDTDGLTQDEFVPRDTVSDDEACAQVFSAQIGAQYSFYVWTVNGTEESQRSPRGYFIANHTTGRFLLTGQNCSEFNVCNLVQPCAHDGHCIWRGELKFSCDCSDGWKGQRCGDEDLCPSQPCLNNGTCSYLSHRMFECSCDQGHYGDICQFTNRCKPNPCQNGGTCDRTENGDYHCNCTGDYSGKDCSVFDPCKKRPCWNGTCEVNATASNGYSCNCHLGYHGELCQIVNRCELDPGICQNGGTCLDIGDGYYICVCSRQFTGSNCESFNACGIDVCQHNSTCTYVAAHEYNCTCKKGNYGQECQHYNPCTSNPCRNGGTCRNASSTFTCMCAEGYSGSLCEQFDPCSQKPCQRGGICQNISNSDYNCTCSPETFGINCSYLNSCLLGFCYNGATCENTTLDGQFVCHCAEGYYGRYCKDYDPCVDTPCFNDGVCLNIFSDSFNCTCRAGFSGKDCSSLDPCVTSPCNNNGECNILSNSTFNCSCYSGFYGDQCSFYDYCVEQPCGVGGSCVVTDDSDMTSLGNGAETVISTNIFEFIKCVCLEDYTGIYCETALGACLSGPCQNDGTCQLQNTGFSCSCKNNFTGQTCETKLPDPPCFSSPCQNGGLCVEEDIDFTCNCSLPFSGDQCQIEVVCEAGSTFDDSGSYDWPLSNHGKTTRIPCEFGPEGKFAERSCLTEEHTVIWGQPKTTSCTKLDEKFASEQLRFLKDLTSDPSKLGPNAVANVTTILEKVFVFSLRNTEIAGVLSDVISNVMNANESALRISQENNSSSQRIVGMVDTYTANAEITDGNNVTLHTENLNILVLDADTMTSNVTFSPGFKMHDNDTTMQVVGQMTLPSAILDNLTASNASKQRVQFAAFGNAKFFMDASTSESVDTVIISATIRGHRIDNLTEPIVFSLPMREADRNYTCKYWNETGEFWSTEGVYTVSTDNNFTECHAYHLTSFAILMDPSPDYHIDPIHDIIQTYITYIGCGVSMLGLTLTVITYGLFKCLHGDKSGKILLNLCVAMLLLNVVFVLGSQKQSVYGREVCMTVAILIHYFLLCSLMWMCIEATNMYRVLVTVFTKYTTNFMLKRCLAAWGIPAVIVGITLGVSLSHYESQDEFCFISHANITAFYVAVLAPACVIVVINIIVFIMVSRVIMRPRFTGHINEKDNTITAAQVRGAFTVMVLLGVAWVFGPLAINEAKLVFTYVFCIANAFQGFLIFIFRCFINPEARAAWVQLIKTGTFKRKRGPTTTSSSSKAEHSKINGTTEDAKRNTMVANGNVWHTDKYLPKSEMEDTHKSDNIKTPGKSNGKSNLKTNGHSNGHNTDMLNGTKVNVIKRDSSTKSRSNKRDLTHL